jgi:hypothetical protein
MRTRGIHASTGAPGHELPPRTAGRKPGDLEWEEVAPSVTHEQIASRAYEIFLARGGRQGDALGDWLAAEHELRAMAMTVPFLTGRPRSDRSH